ncbi:fimbrial protein [Cronobacter dublinensis]|uniref:fimbrial protein n=1 Tax=Cronobacter dublinensis TaxID=413497 RepID=UPI000CFD50AD|nr:fimbrial protein [Cronobacter dublinensis]
MQKTALGLILAAFFSAGVVHAEIKPADVISAPLNITGMLRTSSTGCTVVLSKETVALTHDVSQMSGQSDVEVIPDAAVGIRITGDNECYQRLAQNQLAYKFYGTPDSAEGNVLANTDTSEGAAQGVGVRLSDESNRLIAISTGTLQASSSESFLRMSLVKLSGQQATAGSVKSTLTVQVEQL